MRRDEMRYCSIFGHDYIRLGYVFCACPPDHVDMFEKKGTDIIPAQDFKEPVSLLHVLRASCLCHIRGVQFYSGTILIFVPQHLGDRA